MKTEIEKYLKEIGFEIDEYTHIFILELIASKEYKEKYGMTFNEWITIKWICNKYEVLI